MATFQQLMHFNDGEGLDEADLIRLQSMLANFALEASMNSGQLGNVHNLGHAQTEGGDPGQFDPRPAGLDATAIYVPSPEGFVMSNFAVNGSGQLNLGYGPQQFVQQHNANMGGTPPAGLGTGHIVSYTCDDDEIGITNLARPTVNPRWDSVGIRLGYAEGASESRDFEDASTRALSTTTPNKRQLFLMESETILGAESATPAMPSHTAGYNQLLAIKRLVGETALSTADGDVRMAAMPTRLRTELIPGNAANWDGSNWITSIPFGISKVGTTNHPVHFISRKMHAGCRLVGVEVCAEFTSDNEVNLVRWNAASGLPTTSVLQDIGSGTPIGLSTAGSSFAGLTDFNYPIWGNGRSYGPLFHHLRAGNPTEGKTGEQIGLKIGGTANITGGDRIHYVRFYYLE